MTTISYKKHKFTMPPAAQETSASLDIDHKLVNVLFEAYEQASTIEMKKKLVSQICLELSVPEQVE